MRDSFYKAVTERRRRQEKITQKQWAFPFQKRVRLSATSPRFFSHPQTKTNPQKTVGYSLPSLTQSSTPAALQQ